MDNEGESKEMKVDQTTTISKTTLNNRNLVGHHLNARLCACEQRISNYKVSHALTVD